MEKNDVEKFQDAINMNVNDFVYGWKPSWEALYTKEEIAQEMNIEYKSFGWYRAGTDMCLILPVQGRPEEKQQYRVFVYNDRNPIEIFRKIGETLSQYYP